MISIITTNFNYSEYIAQAINSILNQTYKDFEYIIIDDGSTDNSISVIESFNDNRIRFFKIDHIGRAAALNFAIKQAKYEIIALMDADDISHPQRLESEIKLLKKKNQIIFCEAAYFHKDKILYVNETLSEIINLKSKIFLHGHLNNSSALFYKNLLIENNCYDETLSAYEDYDFWLRVLSGSDFIVLNNPLHYVRIHNRSLTTSNPREKRSILYSIQEKYFKNIDSILNLSQNEKNKIRAWREFFYGNKKKCRQYFKLLQFQNLNLKIIIAFIICYLPEEIVTLFINNRIRLRLNYFLKKFTKYRNLQSEFDEIRFKLDK